MPLGYIRTESSCFELHLTHLELCIKKSDKNFSKGNQHYFENTNVVHVLDL